MPLIILKRTTQASPQITARIEKLSYGLDLHYVDPVEYETWLMGLLPRMLMLIMNGTRRNLAVSWVLCLNSSRNIAAETVAYSVMKHSDEAGLAAQITISNLHMEMSFTTAILSIICKISLFR